MEKKSFENLFKEVRIGNVTLKNRIVMAPMVMCYAGTVGEITEQSISHFEARAKGGVGLIIVEASMIHPSGKGFESEVSIDNDFLIPRLHMLTNAVKVNGAAIAIQLYHGGIHVEARADGLERVGDFIRQFRVTARRRAERGVHM